MGTINRHYEPHFKRLYKDKRSNRKDFVPLKYRNRYERRKFK